MSPPARLITSVLSTVSSLEAIEEEGNELSHAALSPRGKRKKKSKKMATATMDEDTVIHENSMQKEPLGELLNNRVGQHENGIMFSPITRIRPVIHHSTSNKPMDKKKNDDVSFTRCRSIRSLQGSEDLSESQHTMPEKKASSKSLDDSQHESSGTEKLTDDSASSQESREVRFIPATENSSSKRTSISTLYDYDYDGDAESSLHSHDVGHFEEENVLAWRLDSSESLSDWTVVITNADDGIVSKYHVHRNVLAVGPRKSDRFASIFKKHSFSTNDSLTNESCFSFKTLAADAMPMFLDFMYGGTSQLRKMDPRLALGLRKLAQYFGVKLLFKRVMDFIPKHMSTDTALSYYKCSCFANDERILELLAKQCARFIMQIPPSHDLIPEIDQDFLIKIMRAPGYEASCQRYQLSKIVAKFCELNIDTISEKTFFMLTDEQYLPVVHRTVGLSMMETEAEVVSSSSSRKKIETMTSLQERCLKELNKSWQEVADMDREQVSRVCKKLPSGIVTDIFVRTLETVQHRLESSVDISEVVKLQLSKSDAVAYKFGHSSQSATSDVALRKLEKIKNDFEVRMEDMELEHKREMEAMREEYEENLIKLRDLCVEKDRHIANYWTELKRYERLPNNYADATLAKSSKSLGPSMMPEIGNQPKEGRLYIRQKKNHAVFFYNHL